MTSQSVFTDEDTALINEGISVRRKIVKAVTPKNQIPADNKDRKILLEALDGIDAAILSRTRIRVQARANEEQKDLTAMVAKVLLNSRKRTASLPDRQIDPKLSSDYYVDNPVPGERDLGTQSLRIEEIMGE